MLRCVRCRYNTKTLFDHDKVYKELPARLRVELMVKQFQHIIARVPFFQGVSRATVIEICALLHTFPVIKGDLIMQKGEESSELFILIKGLARACPGLDTRGVGRARGGPMPCAP